MKQNLVYLAAVAAISMTSPGVASAQDIGAIYTNCGLGGAIFPNGDQDVAPVIVNILVSSPTVLTQGLLLPDSCSGAGAVSARMLHAAYPQFEADVAVGDGEYINTLMDVMGCDAAVRPALVAEMRSNLSETMADVTYASMPDDEKARSMYIDMYETVDANFAESCDPIE